MFDIKRCLIFTLVVCFCLSANAQEVIYSPYEKYDFRSGDFSVVGKVNNLIYTYRGSSEGFFLDAYNDSMNKVATVVLDFFPSKIYQTRFIAYPTQVMVLYQAIESNKVVQYAALLDETGRLKKGPVQLETVKTGIFGPVRSYFSSVVSEDKKTVLIYSADDKGDEMSFDGKWIDDQLNILKRSHAKYKTDNDIAHGEPVLANDGTVYFPAFTPIGAKSYNDQYWFLSIQPGITKFTATEIPLGGLFTGTPYIKMDEVNQRIYSGSFFSGKKNGDNDGVLYTYYDIAQKGFQNRKAIAFDHNMLAASGEHNRRRAFDDYKVQHLIVKNDGGFVMVAEAYYVATRGSYAPGFGYYSSYYGPFMSSSIREYHYNDIMTLSYDANGNREWFAFIPKEQYSQEDAGMFSSYSLLNTGGTLSFMYNDFNTNNSRIHLSTVDASGKISMRSFEAEGNSNPDWIPRTGKQVAARTIVIPCLYKRQICFAKVVF